MIDRRPRRLSRKQKEALKSLARQTVAQFNLRRQAASLTLANDSLKQSEESYRLVAQSASDVIVTIDERSAILFVNASAEKVLGYKPDELIGKDLSIIIPERFRRAHTAGMRHYMETGERRIPWNGVEVPAVRRDGREIQIEISFGESNERGLRLFTAVIRDVTARKQAEAKLQASEERYRFLSEAVPQQVWTARDDGELDYGNSRTVEYFGKKAGDELLGTDWLKILHPEDVERTIQRWTHSVQTGEPYEIEFRLRREDGEYRWHLAQAVPMRDRSGAIIKWFGTNTDVHDRRLADEALKKSEEYRNLFRHANDAILIFDPADEAVLDANDRACEIYGFEREELLGKSIKEISKEVSRGEEPIRELLRRGTYEEFETVQFRADGTPIHFLINSSVIEFRGRSAVLSINRDITERERISGELQKNVSLLSSTFEATADGILVVSADNKIVAFNDKFARMWGMTAEELRSLPSADAPERIGSQIKKVGDYYEKTNRIDLQADDSTFDVLELKDGRVFERYSQPQKLGDKITGRVFSFRDVTRRWQAESETSKLAAIVESSSDAIISKNPEGVIQSWNAGAENLFGYSSGEAVGRHISLLFSPELLSKEAEIIENILAEKPVEQFETVRVRKDGALIPVSVTVSPIKNAGGEIVGISKIAHDITERKRAEQQLLHNALHDELTNLPNRSLFLEHLRHAIERREGKRGEKSFAVLFLDFDQFKVINDSLGHMEGDNLLRLIAQRLEHSLRSGDIVARLGGDEFTVLLDDLDAPDETVQIAERIQADLKTPFDLSGRQVSITASIGIASGGEDYTQPEEMLRDADIAMYRAKAAGKARHQTFDSSMHEQASRRLQMEIELRRAVEKEEFSVFYQPIVDLQNGGIVAFESLVRWNHPEKGLVSPAEFIPLAEETGLILPLGLGILRESCRRVREWQKNLPSAARLGISVNLSSKQFAQPDLVEQVAAVLGETGLAPRFLKLEITESHVMENSEAAEAMMRRLRALGIELSLDDFGTGYSSLSYLHRLPANYLKVDRSFVSRMTESDENYEIVRTIINLAQNLKMRVVAEGIETEEQMKQLKRLGCDYGQGYLFSKPLAATAARGLLAETNSLPLLPESDATLNLELVG